MNNIEFKAVTISKKARISSTQLVKNQSQGIRHLPHARMASGEEPWVNGRLFSHFVLEHDLFNCKIYVGGYEISFFTVGKYDLFICMKGTSFFLKPLLSKDFPVLRLYILFGPCLNTYQVIMINEHNIYSKIIRCLGKAAEPKFQAFISLACFQPPTNHSRFNSFSFGWDPKKILKKTGVF